MNKSGQTRRRLLEMGVVGLTTGLAGCNSLPGGEDGYDPETPDTHTDEDGDTNEVPDHPVHFHAPNKTFPLLALPQATERPDPGDMSVQHQDTTNFSIEVQDEQSATATLEETNVHREIELRLHVRDANRNWQTVSAPLEPTENSDPETREVKFDISAITLPRDAGSICELVGVDPQFDRTHEFVIKRHQFVGVEHKNGVNWVNAENLNHEYRIRQDGVRKHTSPIGVTGDVNGSKTESPAGYIEHRDYENDRTIFLVTRTPQNGEVFGVSVNIDHEPVRAYKYGNESYQYKYGAVYEGHYATDISHLQELAKITHAAISTIGNNQYERLEMLGDMVQMIPYVPQGDDPPPTIVLYDHFGDCSSKSILMSCILQNSLWDTMPAFIDCEINGVGHWTIGIDTNDINGDTDTTSMLTLRPSSDQVSDGFTDTDWAFFDMTYDSSIGERTEGVEHPGMYDEGDFSVRDYRHSDSPPDY